MKMLRNALDTSSRTPRKDDGSNDPLSEGEDMEDEADDDHL